MSAIVKKLREQLRRRHQRFESTPLPSGSKPQEVAAEFSTEELMEFLEADHSPVRADPVFKERLRQELWLMVEREYGRRSDGENEGS